MILAANKIQHEQLKREQEDIKLEHLRTETAIAELHHHFRNRLAPQFPHREGQGDKE
jgi:hypothetical protein